MPVAIIMDAYPDHPEDWYFLKDDEYDGLGRGDENRTFPNAGAADAWLSKNARSGWCTLIVGEDDD